MIRDREIAQMQGVSVEIRRLPHARGLDLPEYASAGSAGMDLRSASREALTVQAGERVIVPTGWVLAIPSGWEGQIRPRSGRAWKEGLTVINAPGTIDSDYRGEVGVLLVNLGRDPVTIERGQRIAQIVFNRAPRVRWLEVGADDVEPTDRGEGGFGSTGLS